MAIIMPSRALSQQLLSRASHFCPAQLATGFRRVNSTYNLANKPATLRRAPSGLGSILSQCRAYATTTVKTTVKVPAKPRASTRTKKPVKRKSKAASKPKGRKRAKAKAKPKPRKRVLTAKGQAAKAKKDALQKHRDLKSAALLSGSKTLPATAWLVHVAEHTKGKSGQLGALAKEASASYKTLTPEQRERLNHTANQNKATNEAAHQKWLASFTPQQIRDANNARNKLRRESKTKASGSSKRFSRLHDNRVVKQPRTAYNYFFTERALSGDMKGMKVAESSSLIAREWKALNSGEKKPYQDQAETDKNRYLLEYKSVYGEDVPVRRRKTT